MSVRSVINAASFREVDLMSNSYDDVTILKHNGVWMRFAARVPWRLFVYVGVDREQVFP